MYFNNTYIHVLQNQNSQSCNIINAKLFRLAKELSYWSTVKGLFFKRTFFDSKSFTIYMIQKTYWSLLMLTFLDRSIPNSIRMDQPIYLSYLNMTDESLLLSSQVLVNPRSWKTHFNISFSQDMFLIQASYWLSIRYIYID